MITQTRAFHYRKMQICFNSWYKHFAQQKAFARKLTHFKQIFGIHPASSTVARAWCRWRYAARQTKYAAVLHRKYLLRTARRCWSHWKVFHAARNALRAWRHAAKTMATINNNLGMRIRFMRKCRLHAMQRRMLEEWKTLVNRRRSLQDRQSLFKHQLNRELEGVHWRSQEAARFRLGNWFRRWRSGHNKGSIFAWCHYRTRLLQIVLRLWWKTTIHSKQEQVLAAAQQTIGKLSYYHPPQQGYISYSRASNNQKQERKILKREPKVSALKPTNDARRESMRSMRRMLDPTEGQTYSKLYLDSGRDLSTSSSHGIGAKQQNTDTAASYANLGSDARDSNCGAINDFLEHRSKYNIVPKRVDVSLPLQTISSDTISNNQHQQCSDSYTAVHDDLRQHRETFALKNNAPKTQPKMAEMELPLFDDSESNLGQVCLKNSVQLTDVDNSPLDLPSHLPHKQPQNNVRHAAAKSVHFGTTPVVENLEFTTSSERAFKKLATNETFSTMLNPSQSLVPTQQGRSHASKMRPSIHKARIKVVHLSKIEARPLMDLLALSGSSEIEAIAEETLVDMKNEDELEWDSSIIREIVSAYADVTMARTNSNNERMKKTQSRLRICFQMVRDLALFQNDYYIDEMQKVYTTNFKEESIDLPSYELDADKRHEQARLELFLKQVVENHPSYRQYLEKQNLRPSIPLSALNWLAECHLRHHILLQKRTRIRPKKSKEYWIWEQMPEDMDTALEKLLPVITKYMRVLGQLFLRRAVQRSTTTAKPQDYRISTIAFISLMKQVRVFPQLFHRRELENAVRLSSCSSPETEELNFPEFIEALVRCSCSLRWGELGRSKDTAKENDTVVVIKFVMLIFAMEGHGTVLKKRTDDVSAILGFLGEQQKKKQAEKMFRFRNMLADNRCNRLPKKYQLPSVWNQVRLQFSPKTSLTRSPTKSHDTFDELTESWDGGSPCRTLTEPFVFDATTDQPFGLELSPIPSIESSNERHSEQLHVDSTTKKHKLNSENSGSYKTNLPSPKAGVCGMQRDFSVNRGIGSTLGVDQRERISINTIDNVYSEHREDNDSADQVEERPTDTLVQPYLLEPMEKDEFLRDILDSIGDVELILNQPKFVGGNCSNRGKCHKQETSVVTSAQPSPDDCIPSLIDLAADMFCHDHQPPTDIVSAAEYEVPIQDPMLNYLTDVERFTEKNKLGCDCRSVWGSIWTGTAFAGGVQLYAPYFLGYFYGLLICAFIVQAEQEIRPSEAFSSQAPVDKFGQVGNAEE
ncbi:unnamed protein product [Phytophthora fragariaefolia]|uniref:Unnamed protein product n=1 Tax=Phytophthora fragariaefolia TaxID=1490495 RepID=A0A9W6TVB1_9STRA|nr:unnamed protein product [Phytophthora fragariaefolia]